ncbi:heavy-metal-associated domain-containing protein [Suttonella ornithocola]|uniref:Copper-ion-binding protein n=1 Tax=Suttonella ornithocola TaxID=279832 RepID=A0A380MU21_9GAMM|nr:heavy-metal-associated domain-containing protein [Suttonella ornithocola]SUO95423.1 Copper-ion-binding protein [Suttonella ornithocola]
MQKIFTIDGMTCNGCANSVKNALESVPGISEVTVNLAEKQVAVVFDEKKISSQDIIDAIEDAGYDATLKS